MKQSSDVRLRAEKEYKNSKGAFSLLLREVLSNSLHAVLIRMSKEKKTRDYKPAISLRIVQEETECKITLRDNGEGFTDQNRSNFEELDRINQEKESFNFHPLGQGRLSIVYFTDKADYETVYKNSDGLLTKKTIQYPQEDDNLFSFDLFGESQNNVGDDSYTELHLLLNNARTLNRAKTFFNRYPDATSLKQWIIETFFPFIIANEGLSISLYYNAENVIIDKNSIEVDVKGIEFETKLHDNTVYKFKLWLIKKDGTKLQGENEIDCFARNLKARLANGKFSYTIDNQDGYLFYLTSDLFDENVDNKGEQINIAEEDVAAINAAITIELDKEFKNVIDNNRILSSKCFSKFSKKYPSLEVFVQKDAFTSGTRIVSEEDIIKSAVDKKSKIEKGFWISAEDEKRSVDFAKTEECAKLLNSSLHIYVKHRETVLRRLHQLVEMYDTDGNKKPETESEVHELFLRRGVELDGSENQNHLHNLWILDDKYTIFSNNLKAISTKPGQSLSDIYIWADDPRKTKEVLILELKSTTKAHNSGDKKEGMIAQVRRYAQTFYSNPKGCLNWDVEPQNILYTGIILACKSDVNKELISNNVSGYSRIPFLENSYFADDSFVKPNSKNPMDKIPIRIEIYSFEDICNLATSRNEVFFNLLNNEFQVDANSASEES